MPVTPNRSEEIGGAIAKVAQEWVDTNTFAKLKECDADAVRRAARTGAITSTKMWGKTLIIKHPDHDEKNAAWKAGARSRTRRDDGRVRRTIFALDVELAGIQSDYPDVEIIDPAAKRKAARAKKAAAGKVQAEEKVDTEDTGLDTETPVQNPFEGFAQE